MSPELNLKSQRELWTVKNKYTPLDVKTVLECKKRDNLSDYTAPKMGLSYSKLNRDFIDCFTEAVKKYPSSDIETVATISVMSDMVGHLMYILKRAIDLSLIKEIGSEAVYEIDSSPLAAYINGEIEVDYFTQPKFIQNIISRHQPSFKNHLRLLRRKLQRIKTSASDRVDIMHPNQLLLEHASKHNYKTCY